MTENENDPAVDKWTAIGQAMRILMEAPELAKLRADIEKEFGKPEERP